MNLPSEMRAAASSGLRALLLGTLALAVTTTVWVTLISGLVVVLRPALGPGGALLAVAGGLTAICLLVFVALRVSRGKPPPRPAFPASAAAFAIGANVLGSPVGRRLALGATGVLLLGIAVLPSVLRRPRAEPASSATTGPAAEPRRGASS